VQGADGHCPRDSSAIVIEVRPMRPEDQAEWDAVAISSDDAWLSHSWHWNVAIEEGVQGGERRSLVVVRDGSLVGIAPQHLHTRRRGPLVRRVLYANYFAGGGLALANDVVGDARAECFAAVLRATHDQARRDGADKLMLFLPSLSRRNLRGDLEARRALDGGGLLDQSSRALVIRLAGRTKDEVWAAMEGRARTKIRKAERAGVSVTRSSGRDAVEPLYALHLETCKRTGDVPSPLEYFEATVASGHFHVFFAMLEGKIIGAQALALYGGRALFDVSASIDQALRVGANNLLIWTALQWLLDAGAEAYELGVLPGPEQPQGSKLATIAWHHRSFGGEEVPAYSAQFVYRRRQEAIFSLGRRILHRAGRSGNVIAAGVAVISSGS
jgi:hypothetical protein